MNGRNQENPQRGLPLDGVTVVSIEQAIAAPLASRYLGHLGARVIKIERNGTGDFARSYDRTVHGQSSHFVWANANKESLELDLKSPFGADTVRRLIRRADVFLHNLAPGAIERLGLDAPTLHEENPRLIVARISGYGATGPYRSRKAYDLLLQSETGMLSVTGTPASPSKAGIPVADIAAGMYAYSGILGALYEREKTGTGQFIDISLLDSLTEWMGFPRYFALYGGAQPSRSGAHHAAIAPYGPHRVQGGEQVFLAIQNNREWERFCAEIIGDENLSRDPRFADNSERVANRDDLQGIIEEALRARSADEVVTGLERAGIASGRMRDVAEAAEHPQLVARDRIRRLRTPAGDVDAARPPMLNDQRETRMGPVPALGEHTDEILAWLGVSPDPEADT